MSSLKSFKTEEILSTIRKEVTVTTVTSVTTTKRITHENVCSDPHSECKLSDHTNFDKETKRKTTNDNREPLGPWDIPDGPPPPQVENNNCHPDDRYL